MSKLIWDAIGERVFETGVSHGVLYPIDAGAYPLGVAWNGLTAVTESPSGAEPTDLWADDSLYAVLRAAEKFGATIEAFTYPDEFAECDGSAEISTGVTVGQQPRKTFGFCYRTVVGNDSNPEAGYKLHIVYGATASPSEKGYATVNDSPEAITFSWEVTTVPVPVPGKKPSATLTLDSTKFNTEPLKAKLAALEEVLYGKDAVAEPPSAAVVARLPLPAEIISILAA